MSVNFTTDKVVSADGTTIGYRQIGSGPRLILVHGGMMTSAQFSQLALALADAFTVYIPDRRGRGLSGPHGDHYCLDRECEDIQALVRKTGAQNMFGLSSGAIVALHTALTLPNEIRKLALYEPPLALDDLSLLDWVPRFEAELVKGDLAAAMVTIIKAIGDSSFMTALPRFVLVPFMRIAIEADAKEDKTDDLPVKALIPTMHFDPQLVRETYGKVQSYSTLRADLLLLGGTQSQGYLKAALNTLSTILPNAQRVTLQGTGHLAANNGGQPQRVALELKHFFAESSSS